MLKFSLKQKIFSGYIILIIIILALGLAAFLSIQRLFVIQENLHSQTRGIADLYQLEAHLGLFSADLSARGATLNKSSLDKLSEHFASAKQAFEKYEAINRSAVSADVLPQID